MRNKAMLAGLVFCVSSSMAHHRLQQREQIPKQLWGRWTIVRNLHTPGVTCWDEKQAQTLIGTALEYRADSFKWERKSIPNLGSKITETTAQQFAADNSGSGGAVTFHDLGIDAPAAKQIEIRHDEVKVYPQSMDCCNTAPGETVLLKSSDTLILNLCGVFYEATSARAVR